MIDKDLIGLTNKLKKTLEDQKKAAQIALQKIPEGETKSKLESLLKSASTGKLKPEDAQRELNKIIEKHAGSN